MRSRHFSNAYWLIALGFILLESAIIKIFKLLPDIIPVYLPGTTSIIFNLDKKIYAIIVGVLIITSLSLRKIYKKRPVSRNYKVKTLIILIILLILLISSFYILVRIEI